MKPLIDKKILLEKYDGKGGWTYARIPHVVRDSKTAFGYVKVQGTIDDYVITQCNLMPMTDGNLFLPVKTEIRKAIKKEAGDKVHIILYPDDNPQEVPGEFLLCLQDEPKAHKFFNKLSNSEKKYYINWIYGAKKEETKISRMATAINKLTMGLKMHDKAPKDE